MNLLIVFLYVIKANKKNINEIKNGISVQINGQYRSYNQMMENGKSKLMLTMFVRELKAFDENQNPNKIEIVGYICKDPEVIQDFLDFVAPCFLNFD